MRRQGVALLLALSAVPVWAADPAQRLAAAVQSPADLPAVAREVQAELAEGRHFGREVAIARAIAPVWRRCPEDAALWQTLHGLIGATATALYLADRAAALELAVDVPLRCAAAGNAAAWQTLWTLEPAWPELSARLAAAWPRLLEVAAAHPEWLAQLAKLCSYRGERRWRVSVPDATLRRLRAAFVARAWDGSLIDLPACLADPAGAELWLAVAEARTIALPPEAAGGSITAERLRERALTQLAGEPFALDAAQAGRVAERLAEARADDGRLVGAALQVLAREDVPMPPLSEAGLAAVVRALDEPQTRPLAIRVLSRAGPSGARALWQHYVSLAPAERDSDLEAALRRAAAHLRPQILARWRQTQDPALAPLLAACGEWAALREAALGSEPQLAAAAVKALAGALAERPEEAALREALRAVALSDRPARLRAPAWRALLLAGDREVGWSRLAASFDAPSQREAALALLSGIVEVTRPPVILERLAAIAADPQVSKAVRLAALEQLRYNSNAARWEMQAIDPGEKAAARERAERLWDELAPFESRIRPLLRDPDADLRRAAAEYFEVTPAREPETVADLLAALDDENPYVRGSVAAALASARAPAGTLLPDVERVLARTRDARLAERLRQLRINLLREDPAAVEPLARIVLHREGSAAERQWLKRRGELPPPVVEALLARLAAEPVSTWLPRRFASFEKMIETALAEERDPSAPTLLTALVPSGRLSEWYVALALERARDWHERLALLLAAPSLPAERHAALIELFVQAVREDATDPLTAAAVFGPLGFDAVRAVADAFAEDPKRLGRAAGWVREAHDKAGLAGLAGGSGPTFPPIPAEALPWAAERVRAHLAAGEPELLGHFLDLIQLYEAAHPSIEFKAAAWQAGLTPALLERIDERPWCRAVRDHVHTLLGRMIPPRCGGASPWG